MQAMNTEITQALACKKAIEELSTLRATIKKVKAEVQFGSPQKSCTGVGICRVTMLTSSVRTNDTNSNKRSIAYLSLTREKHLKVSFFKESLSPLARKIYFHNMKFVVQDDISFPKTIAERLTLPAIKIGTGVYKVEETEQFLNVVFH